MEADRGDSIPDKMSVSKVIEHLGDPMLWAFCKSSNPTIVHLAQEAFYLNFFKGLMFLASTVPAYAIIFFVTIILKGMGYTAAMALLLTAPPGVFAVRKINLLLKE